MTNDGRKISRKHTNKLNNLDLIQSCIILKLKKLNCFLCISKLKNFSHHYGNISKCQKILCINFTCVFQVTILHVFQATLIITTMTQN